MDNSYRKKIFYTLAEKRVEVVEKSASEANSEVFMHTDCLVCARCCKGYNAIVNESDIIRLADHLNMKVTVFASSYLILDEDDEWCLNGSPCPFLQEDNKCSVYEVRPSSCADYPHMGSPGLMDREQLTLVNAEICPAVDAILENIARKLDIT